MIEEERKFNSLVHATRSFDILEQSIAIYKMCDCAPGDSRCDNCPLHLYIIEESHNSTKTPTSFCMLLRELNDLSLCAKHSRGNDAK